jgi:hypothetical protein
VAAIVSAVIGRHQDDVAVAESRDQPADLPVGDLDL